MSSPSSAASPVTPSSLSSMPEPMLKAHLKMLNLSGPRLSEAVGINENTYGRWMRKESATMKDENITKLRDWLLPRTLAEVQQYHSRNFPKKLHKEVKEATDRGEIGPNRFRTLKRKCEAAQEESMPPPTKPKISKQQIRRFVKTKQRKD